MMQMSELKQSVKVAMVLYPWSSGRGPTKLIATLLPHLSGMGRGWRGPEDLEVEDLKC